LAATTNYNPSLHDALPILRSQKQNEKSESSATPAAAGVTRRSVLKGSTAAMGAAATFAALGTNFAWAQVSEEIKVGMIGAGGRADRKSTRLNSSHVKISYA